MLKIDEVRAILFNSVEDVAIEQDFKQRKFSQGGGLLRITNSITDVVGWGMYHYGERKQFGGFSAYNCHNEIREIELPVLIKHKLIGSGSKIKDWSYAFCPKDGFPVIKMDNHEIDSLNKIEFLKEVYRDFFIKKALPYFQKWNSLLTIYDYVKDVENDKETGLVSFPRYKKAILMRLCNDSKYKEYFYSYLKEKEMLYLEDTLNDDRIMYFNAAKEMFELLNLIQPKYNL